MTDYRVGIPFIDFPFKDGDVVKSGNFMQLEPDTLIGVGSGHVIVYDGLFINCIPPSTWELPGGNWCQKSFCTHLRPDLIARGLKACKEGCEHRQGDQKQWVRTDEKDYRKEKRSLSPGKPDVQVLKEVDADGVTIQTFQKKVFVYEDLVTKRGSAVKADK